MVSKLKYYNDDLKINKTAQEYLYSRCLDYKHLLTTYKIGSCNKPDDYFNGYIVFPFIENKKVVFLTGRSYRKLELIHKHLYGQIPTFFNVNRIYDTDKILICECPIDCISAELLGYDAIAVAGTNISPSGLQKLIKLKEKDITIVFDIDQNNAGLKGSKKLSSKLYNELDIIPYVCQLELISEKSTDINDILVNFSKKDGKSFIDKCLSKRFKFSEEELKKNKNKVSVNTDYDIVSIISEYVPSVKKMGNYYKCYCPFHSDLNSPSLTIYEHTQSYFCFGCGKSGNAVKFIMDILSINYKDAIKWLNYHFNN